jgi:tetratricopeptide (TPR) repeat protein
MAGKPFLLRRVGPKHARAFHPLLWGGALFLKKATLWKAASSYGYPRIYRRLLEQTREHVPDPVRRKHANRAIAGAIRAPQEALAMLTDSEVYPVLEKIARRGDAGAKHIMPPFLYTLLRTGLEATAPVKYSAGVRSAASAMRTKSSDPRRPPLPPPRSATRRFSTSAPPPPQQEPLGVFVRRETKVVLGLSLGTALLLYLYRELKPSDGGPDDLPAARYRHALLTRATANKKQGNTRKAIELYEKLLSLEVGRQHLLPPPAPGKEFTLELHVLWQLGELHRKAGQTQRALACFEEAAGKAAARPNLALETGTLYDRAGSCVQDQLIDAMATMTELEIQKIRHLQATAESLYLTAVKHLLPLETASPIFAVASKLDTPGALRAFMDEGHKTHPGENVPLLTGRDAELAALASGSLYNYASLLAVTGRLGAARAVVRRSAVLGRLAGAKEENLEKVLALLEQLENRMAMTE